MNIVLLGPPGAGKGTQASLIKDYLNLKTISTGDLVRKSIKSKTPLGAQVKEAYDSGSLVSDDIIMDLIKTEFSQTELGTHFLFDGFPRTIQQAEAFEAMREDLSLDLLVIEIYVSDYQILVERILERAAESDKTRADDANRDVISNRLKVYKELTEPLSAYYGSKNLLKRVDGIGTIEEVFESIKKAISD